ncbi:multicopper oxidase-domain-containing protein [Suillus americanus]|nr:multicopper oxidase-domain-containing protein [Suillus americanus]
MGIHSFKPCIAVRIPSSFASQLKLYSKYCTFLIQYRYSTFMPGVARILTVMAWYDGPGTDCKGNQGQTSIAGGCGSIYRGPTTTSHKPQDYRLRARTPATAPEPLALPMTCARRWSIAPTPDLPTTMNKSASIMLHYLKSKDSLTICIFSVDNHKLTIIEVDGQYVEPLVVDSVQIYAAQRCSFIPETNQPVDNYWVHADQNSGTKFTPSAVCRFLRCGPQDQDNSKLRRGADVNLNLILGKNETNFNFHINGVHYTSPRVPVLLIHSTSMGAHSTVIRGAGSSCYNYVSPVMRNTVTTVTGDYGLSASSRPSQKLYTWLHWHMYRGLRRRYVVIFVVPCTLPSSILRVCILTTSPSQITRNDNNASERLQTPRWPS